MNSLFTTPKINKLSAIGLLILVSAAVLHIDWKAEASKDLHATAATYELLERPKAIQHGIEWRQVQESWSKYKVRLASNDADPKAKLALAELCVKEARVTGEHGYYYPMALKLTDEVVLDADAAKELQFYALTLKAGVQLSLHEFAAARETGLQAQELNPHNAQICGVLTDAFVELGEYDKAIAMADRMVAIRPDLRSYSRVAYLREIFGQVDGAIEALEMAITAGYPGDEETTWAMLTLADLSLEYGSPEKAASLYRQILLDRPNYPFAVAGLAKVQWKQGNYAEAEAGFEQAIKIIPEVGFYIDLATMKKELDQPYSYLIGDILQMLKEDTDAGHIMNMEYADIYYDLLEKPKEALEYLKIEHNIRPNNIDVNLRLAKVYHGLDSSAEARLHLEAALITDSKDPSIKEITKAIATS